MFPLFMLIVRQCGLGLQPAFTGEYFSTSAHQKCMQSFFHQSPCNVYWQEILHVGNGAKVSIVAIHKRGVQFHLTLDIWKSAISNRVIRRIELQSADRVLQNVMTMSAGKQISF